MNTILQKRIKEAAEKIVCSVQCAYFDLDKTCNCYAKKFCIKTAEEVLQNQWISVEEALPPLREKGTENRSWSDWVLIMTHEGIAFMDCYAFHRKEWLNNGNDVTHWMPIPELKGGEK